VEEASELLELPYGWSDGVVSEEFAAACDLSLADVRPFSSLRSILEASESFEPGFRPRRCFSNIHSTLARLHL
jgi:hypothetical protein